LPALYSVSTSDYRDVTVGSNGYRATRGYDLASGLGAPGGASLIADLVNYTAHVSPQTRKTKLARRVSTKQAAHPGVLAAVKAHPAAVQAGWWVRKAPSSISRSESV
jgi:hypothetical protein